MNPPTNPARAITPWPGTVAPASVLALVLPAGTAAAGPPQEFDLAFATYFGGTNFDSIRDVCVESQGNIVAVGGTSSPEFPTTPGAFCRTFQAGGKALGSGGPCRALVAKFDPRGRLLWSTMLGGPNYDRAHGVAADRQGNLYVAGRASEGFPVTKGAFQTEQRSQL